MKTVATSHFDPERLRSTLDALGDIWGRPSTLAESGVHHLYSTASKQVKHAFGWVLADFAPVRSAHLGRLEPGGFIVPHTDAGPWYERWQVPIYAAGYWHNGHVPEAGVAFRVYNHLPHAVWNLTPFLPRVHLIIDRAVRVPGELHPQTLHPELIPERLRDMVERAQNGA